MDETPPDFLVDDHVQDRIDEAVEVGQNHHVPDPYFWDVVILQHEEDRIRPPADQEGGSDDPHDNCDAGEMLVILPKIDC